MKKIKTLLSLVAAMALCSCQADKSYSIEGAIYGGRNFDDQTIYLVPFSGSTAGRIDSAKVRDGCFRFDGTAEAGGIFIVRMRPMMRLFIEELILIREPGNIRAMLSEHSSASGTPLNDSLQSWREYKQTIDTQLEDIRKKLRRADPRETARLKASQDSLRTLFDKHNRASALANSGNTFGEFLDSWVIR